MNGRKAKQLRRTARQFTVGLPHVKYGVQVHNKTIYSEKAGKDVTYQVGTLRLIQCTRLAYQNLKKLYKQQRYDRSNRRIRMVSQVPNETAQAA